MELHTNIAVAARIVGDVEEEKLEQAIDIVCRMHPRGAGSPLMNIAMPGFPGTAFQEPPCV